MLAAATTLHPATRLIGRHTRNEDRPSSMAAGPASASPVTTVWKWLTAALDELDYGMVVLSDDMNVVHCNEAASVELDDCHPLEVSNNELRARLARDVAPLHAAVESAARRGLRKLLTLGKDEHRASVSVIPLTASETGARAVLIVFAKRAVCETLSIQGFARDYGLTDAETRVLVALCNDLPPTRVARQSGVAISTVRSQIGSLRHKTGAASIRALVRQVAVLPPIKGVLRKKTACSDAPSFPLRLAGA